MSTVLAIDPGNVQSAYCLIDVATRQPIQFAKVDNIDVLDELALHPQAHTAIEMIAAYGMAVGADVFETCVWIGRFAQQRCTLHGTMPELVPRPSVKLHHCHSRKAKDSNVTRALADRFAYGQPNYGKGTNASPGWFHGFHRDVWQAYALAVYLADELTGRG